MFMKTGKKQAAVSTMDLLQEKEAQLALQTKRSELAVQSVKKSIDDLEQVNGDIQKAMEEIDTYLLRLTDTRKGLAATRNKNERVMQNFSKLLCLDEEVAE